MKRRALLAGVGLWILWPAVRSFAQQGRVWRIGVLETTPMALNGPNYEALREGLRELGYAEGRNLLIEYRSVDGRQERFRELANELVRMKVDVIVTRGTPATQAAKAATGVIPIVSTAFSDPVSTGLVKSLARPGGNVTGMEPLALQLMQKRVELLKETFPWITQIGFVGNTANSMLPIAWHETVAAARSLGIEAQLHDVRKPEALGPEFDVLARQGRGALIVGIGSFTQANRKSLVELAAKHRLPAMYLAREFVDAGGLMSYAVSYPDLYYRAASYVDKILKGAGPGDLPVERATKFELIINLRTAKALGVEIPASVMLRVDEVIE